MKAPRVGFIGLGAMGMGMARNLHAAGWLSIRLEPHPRARRGAGR